MLAVQIDKAENIFTVGRQVLDKGLIYLQKIQRQPFQIAQG
jgi:hypothetical protein